MSKCVQRQVCQARPWDIKAKARPPGPRDHPPPHTPWGSLPWALISLHLVPLEDEESPVILLQLCRNAVRVHKIISLNPGPTMPHGGISIKIFITFLWPPPVVPRDSSSLTFLSTSSKLSASLLCFPFKLSYLFRLSWASKQIFPSMPTFHLT